ncbi:MAG: hypothetical protein HY343_08885 [Lentisphaerae bacterium]|nr:hypothetical protein [Lentisphaerota bacterium]
MRFGPHSAAVQPVLKGLFVLLLGTGLYGCSTPLDSARMSFYAGQFQQADRAMTPLPKGEKDKALYLMERGMMRHALRAYDDSSLDWRDAGDIQEQLRTHSVAHGAVSLVSNDKALSFGGKPFERTLMYAFLAKNYLAQHNWDYAAIAARNVIAQLETLNGFPDIAYGRYMAGFCMEMLNDYGNAAIQYQKASETARMVFVDRNTGRLTPRREGETQAVDQASLYVIPQPASTPELVCFISMGRIPTGESANWALSHGAQYAPYAELYADDRCLGRSYPLNNTADLIQATEKRLALLQMAKDLTRIAIKETIATAVESNNKDMGALVRLALFAMEEPDMRRFETLPLWLEVARVPCPETLTEITVVFKNSLGNTTGTQTVTAPISRHGKVYVSFCRDIISRP